MKPFNLPRNCFGCHADAYTATRSPDHVRAGFPTSCESCHFANHTSWSQAVFRHAFPIGSGRHAGFACSDCHVAADFRQFQCTGCHAHERSEMDDEHDDVGGYVYQSQACFACHPDGRE